MQFNSKRLAQLSGLLTEGAEDTAKEEVDEGCEQCDETVDEGYEESNETVDEMKSEELDESHVRSIIRSQLETIWASGAVFGKEVTQSNGVTMGFAGPGFKSEAAPGSLVAQVYGKLPAPQKGVTMGFPGVGFKNSK